MSRIHTHAPKEPKPFSPRRKLRLKQLGILALSLVAIYLLFIFVNIIVETIRPKPRIALGATYSTQYAYFLGLDPRATFTALLDELGVRQFRIPTYWENLEPEPGKFNFEELDWVLDEAAKRGARVLLVVGFKQPRWPECHAPAWVHELGEAERKEKTLAFVRTVVNRYRSHPAVHLWQVENEPLLEAFGVCPPADREFLKQEVALVRALDPKPIVVTESGELSTWARTVGISDILGISMYRVSWNAVLGYIYYPLTPNFYRQRARAVESFTRRIIVTELQAEPWVPQGILNATRDEQLRSMDAKRLRDNINFVQRAGFDEVYLWGVEWWYWLREKQGDSSMWDAGRALFHTEVRPQY